MLPQTGRAPGPPSQRPAALQDRTYGEGRSGWDSRFHYVASNLSNRGSNLEGVEDYDIFRAGDAKFAVIGVVNEKAPTLVAPGSLGTMSRTDSVAAAMAAKAAAQGGGCRRVHRDHRHGCHRLHGL